MKKKLLGMALALCMALSLFPVGALAAETAPADGWYVLKIMGNYVNFDSTNGAELRDNSATKNEGFLLEHKGDGQVTLMLENGTFLGIATAYKNGVRVKPVNAPYLWKIAPVDSGTFSLRPADRAEMVLNASEEKNVDGTDVLLWTHDGKNPPKNIKVEFAPIAARVVTAAPVAANFTLDGKAVSVPQAYTVAGGSYLQLRGIAVLLNGTAAQFNVGWDGTNAVIEAGKAYTGAANPAALVTTIHVKSSVHPFMLDGASASFDNAYLIGGSNYLSLREVAAKLSGTASQFNVYTDAAGTEVIAPGVPFTGIAPA
ncbi:MAG: hypothetical protein RR544_05020 [Oscillospiraceae bacterium]